MKDRKTSAYHPQDEDMAPLEKWGGALKEHSYWLTMAAVVVVALAAGLLLWNIRKESKLDEVWTEMSEVRLDPLDTISLGPGRLLPVWKTLGVAVPFKENEDEQTRTRREAANEQRMALAQSGWYRLGTEQGKEDPIRVKALLERARGTDAEPWVLYHLGTVYYARAEYKAAVGVFEDLARRFEGHLCGSWAALDLERSRAELSWKKDHIVPEMGDTVAVELETTVGTLTISLYRERSPQLVESLLGLVRNRKFEGMMFYSSTEGTGDAALFCGDPNANGTGSLAPDMPETILPVSHVHGTVGMDISGTGRSSGSRFYITKLPEVTEATIREKYSNFPPQYLSQLLPRALSQETQRSAESRQWVRDQLDGKRSIVGAVTGGLDLLDKLGGHWVLRARIVPSE